MSIPSKEQRAEWRKLAAETSMVSAVGEYTPLEFTTLLDAVDALETRLAALCDTVEAHEIESLQCDGREEEHCNCLREQVKKARALLSLA